MLKIFTPEERKAMGEVRSYDIEADYPNKAFIMINTRNYYRIVDGIKCNSGIIGTLYAMADYEDQDDYTKAIAEASNIDGVIDVATFTNFDIKDGMYYVEK